MVDDGLRSEERAADVDVEDPVVLGLAELRDRRREALDAGVQEGQIDATESGGRIDARGDPGGRRDVRGDTDPASPSASATTRRAWSLMSVATTLAPSSASRLHVALPIPPAAPVTKTVFPERPFNMSASDLCWQPSAWHRLLRVVLSRGVRPTASFVVRSRNKGPDSGRC